MNEVNITSEDDLRAWLSDKPANWAQAIALRAALRALPFIADSGEVWLNSFALLPFGALVTSWMQQVDRSIFVRTDESRANARFGGESFDFTAYKNDGLAAAAADASYHSADAQSGSIHVVSDCIQGAIRAAEAFRYASVRHGVAGETGDCAADTLWNSVEVDCQFLIDLAEGNSASALATQPFWDFPSEQWDDDDLLSQFTQRLLSIDHNYKNWIDWYERRIRGERAAFDIPGDKGRIEDKKILRRLAEATDEDFWGKGHEYVNATLKGWLDEARARVAPPIVVVPASGVALGSSVAIGVTSKAELETFPLPQNRNVLSFGSTPEGRISIDASALADQMRNDQGAQDRYAEAVCEAKAVLGPVPAQQCRCEAYKATGKLPCRRR
jgi:hypothetical protein